MDLARRSFDVMWINYVYEGIADLDLWKKKFFSTLEISPVLASALLLILNWFQKNYLYSHCWL